MSKRALAFYVTKLSRSLRLSASAALREPLLKGIPINESVDKKGNVKNL